MKLGSLFSGYGGLDQAVHAAFGDVTTAWVSDFDTGPNKILAHRYPDAPNIGDITTIDWTQVEPVDIIAGGSPCQDVSTSGRRAGMKPGTRSGLWESMREAIAIIQPTYVVWENVLGALSAEANSDSEVEYDQGPMGDAGRGPVLRALGRVLGDLASLGFDAGWTTIRASDVGAPHGRARVFVVAWRRDAPNPSSCGGRRRGPVPGTRPSGEPDTQAHGADTRHGGPGADVGLVEGVADPSGLGPCHDLKRGMPRLPAPTGTSSPRGPLTDWGLYAAAVHRWEQLRGPAPAPTELTVRGKHRLSPLFVEWMMGLPEGWVTDTPGITRNEALKALGNGVVPQQGAVAIRYLLDLMEGQDQ